MPSPSIVLAFILATLYGAGFHVIFGGDIRRLALFLISGWLGFSLGQVFGGIVGIKLFGIGPINTFAATLGAGIALLVTHFLTNTGQRTSRQTDEVEQ